ncbi:MAG: hypothetical protein Q7T74_05095 [Candidatus Saccharibacteria bacterium]|nr:hypothetical protein [Candidatus Saccharibacteria bacterium]
MFVDQEKRRKTKQMFVDGVDVRTPKVEISRLTPEDAKEFLDKIKPLQYVALARVIDPLIEAVVSEPLVLKRGSGTFFELHKAATDRFTDAIVALRDTDEYIEAEEYPKMIGEINPQKHSELFTQLQGGAWTATNTMLGLLKDIPAIIEHHAGSLDLTTDDMAKIASNSKRLAWNNATMSGPRLMALQHAVFLDYWTDKAYGEDNIEKVENYQLTRSADGAIQSVSYKDLSEIVVPKGYRGRDEGPLKQDIALKDVKDTMGVTIGCPVTLVKGRMEDLWEWYTEAIRQSGCWTSDE